MASSGNAESLLAKPIVSNTGQDNSNIVAETAANIGGMIGTLYSSENSAIVLEKLLIFTIPERKNTFPIHNLIITSKNGCKMQAYFINMLYIFIIIGIKFLRLTVYTL